MTKYAMQSSCYARHIKADVFVSSEERAILTFKSGLATDPAISMHIPPAVAQATAAAFNEAMEKHEAAK